jgi:hypothetical protein
VIQYSAADFITTGKKIKCETGPRPIKKGEYPKLHAF